MRMDEPVRVGLVFSRSGQRLFVYVSRYWAQQYETRVMAEAGAPLFEQTFYRHGSVSLAEHFMPQ